MIKNNSPQIFFNHDQKNYLINYIILLMIKNIYLIKKMFVNKYF